MQEGDVMAIAIATEIVIWPCGAAFHHSLGAALKLVTIRPVSASELAA